ncbi:MAG TPA: C25 family cysteine peptidase [Candidatus Cloacimonadota bacterium]|nr:C25 family cysteine peptidase [Candidatus Cloacimonadota bacterium]
MKRLLIMLTFLTLVVLLAATQGTINLSSAPNTVQMVRSSDEGLTIRYSIQSLNYEEVQTSSGIFTDLFVRDYAYTIETGSPRLPLIRQIISVPVGASVQASLVNPQWQTIDLAAHGINYPIMPRQESVSKSADPATVQFVINQDVYASNKWSDNLSARVEEIGFMRGERLFAVDFVPVRYNPVTKQIEVITSTDVNVVFVGGDLAATAELRARTYSPAFASIHQGTILNYQMDRSSLNRYPMSYVIVTPNNFVTTLQPFVDWKKKEGFDVIVATTETIGTTANAIKTYLQGLWNNATPTAPAPTYVLFVGDVAQVPSNNGQQSGGHITDLTYVRLQGTDYVPEMYYGRFSATNTTELTSIINKTLMHEQYTMPSDQYLDNAVMIAGVDSSWSPTHANGQINFGTTNYFNAAHNINSHTYLYPASGSSESQIIANINAGTSYVNYTAHGSETTWYDPAMSISDINGFTNTNKYPVMVGNCCLTNAFNTGVCFGEALIRASNKGAVAYIGGTNSTYWDEDYWWGVGYKPPVVGTGSPWVANRTGAYDAIFHDHSEPFADWAATTGATVFMGNMAVVQSNSSRINYYWEIYSIMGDPSLNIYIGIPPVNNAVVPETTFIGTGSMDLVVEPYTYVALSMNGILHGVGLADASGNLSLSFTPFDGPGTANLVMTRSRRRPTFANISVIPNSGPYVTVNAVTVNDGNDNIAQAGETVGLDLTFNNVGVLNATGLTASVATTSPYASFSQTSVPIADVPANGTLTVSNLFTMVIAPLTPDQTNVDLAITVTDGTNVWNSNRTVVVAAPNVLFGSVTMADGNGNGFNESGETVTITANISNTGHVASQAGTLALQMGFANATLTETNFVVPAIPATGNAPVTFMLILGSNIPDGTIIPIGLAYTAGSTMLNYSLMLSVGITGDGFETNSFTSFPWQNTSSIPWTIASGTGVAHSGTYAAKSGTISHNGSTALQVTMNVGVAGNITFWRKVSSESGYDFLKFHIDGTEMGSWSGTQDWTQITVPVSAGSRTFKWTYSKDTSVSSGSDCAWIDDIVFPSSGVGAAAILYVPTEAIIFTDVPLNTTVSSDFAVRNLGNINMSGMISVPAGFNLSSDGINLSPNYTYSLTANASQVFTLSYAVGATPVNIEDSITISSNDPTNPAIQISVTLNTAVDADDPTGVPLVTKLDGNYPNPFNPETAISYSIKEAGPVRINIYNLKGQLVKTLVNTDQPAGNHRVVWNGSDNNGRGVASGIYLYRMETQSYNKTLKMMLMK